MREELLRIADRIDAAYEGAYMSGVSADLRALAEKCGGAAPSQPVADREAARARFPDPAFQRWLDEGISDAGHTVFCTLGDVADAWAGWSAKSYYAQPVALPDGWVAVMQALVHHIEQETCQHEETYRGGAIWEICRDCGEKWSDDRNPKPEFAWPKCVEDARVLLAAAPEVPRG